MNHSLKPASRLTIVFIIAVILSGSVLAYFGINNISNQKKLTENRILEEQRELFIRISESINGLLGKVTRGMSDEIILTGIIKDTLIKRAGEFDFIRHPFILNKEVSFIYPNFSGIPQNSPTIKLTDRYISSFAAGEKAEFNEKNLRKARDNYLLSLNYSSAKSDSVKALNALSRVSVKLNNNEDAIDNYTSIITNYSDVTDANGFPYVYYALPQLLKLTDQANYKKMLPAIQLCLDKMETGSIPLNYSTEELLALISDRLKEFIIKDLDDSIKIIRLITSISQQSQFIRLYGDEMKELVIKVNQDIYPAAGNNFVLIKAVAGKGQDNFLINTHFENPTGFLIDRKKFLNAVLATDLQAGLEFDYNIEFPDSFNLKTTSDKLFYTSQLSPWLPDQQTVISLADEDLIKDFVNRRSWIYGIASVLLLVAMLLGVALILRDIAREKHLARLRSDFISNVTHELKTPLTSIRMYAESLMMGRIKSTTAQKEYLSVVINESERLKRMINNILEFSKMEKEKQEYHPVETSLSDILLASIRDMNYWLEEKGFKLDIEIDQNIIAKVDPGKFHQVYINLLSNAIKYSGESRKISIRLFRNSDSVITEIEDEGIGIAKDNLEKIFEEFYRVEQEDSGDATGTGLGLTVARVIVEAHRGKILVDSEIGKGSKFTVRMPLPVNNGTKIYE